MKCHFIKPHKRPFVVPLQIYEPINNKKINSVCRRISILFVELTMLKDGIKKEGDNIGKERNILRKRGGQA